MKSNSVANKPPQVSPGALKVRGAAEYLSVSPITVYRLIARGLITPNRALRHIIIPIAELNRFLKNE